MPKRRSKLQLTVERFIQSIQDVIDMAAVAHEPLEEGWADAMESEIRFSGGETRKLGANYFSGQLKETQEAEKLAVELVGILSSNPSRVELPVNQWFVPNWEKIVYRLQELIAKLLPLSQAGSNQERRRDRLTDEELEKVRQLFLKRPEAQLKDIRKLGFGGNKSQAARQIMRKEGLDNSRPRKRRRKT